MLAGHLAVALGAKRVDRRLPLGATVAAAFALDLLWPVFLLLGLESVRVHPGDTAFTNLAFDSYPWTHSLVVVIGWALLGGVSGWAVAKSWRGACVLGTLVLSHWILDLITHRPDLPVWPSGPVVGLGLWNSVVATILVEGALLGMGVWLYVGATEARDQAGRWGLIALVALVGGIWVTQPWSPPPPSASAVAWGGLSFWLIVPWAAWIERHRATR